MKKTIGALVVAAAVAGVAIAEARPGRWYGHDHDRIRHGRNIDLGSVRIGDEYGRHDADTIDVINRLGIECNLTHIKLSTGRDDVMIQRVEVQYRSGLRDSIDLDDNDDYGRRRGNERGLYLRPYDSSRWLDLDDVQDGYTSGRCVDRITVIGTDMRRREFFSDWFNRRGADVQVSGLLMDRPRYDPRPNPPPYRPAPPPHRPGRPGRGGGHR